MSRPAKFYQLAFLISLLSVLFLYFPTKTFAAIYYVSTTGNNSNDGSISSPWLTLDKAEDTASDGDEIRVVPGTYAENDASCSCWAVAKQLTWLADSNGDGTADGYVTVRGSGGATKVSLFSGTKTRVIRNFIFDGQSTRSNTVYFNTGAGNVSFYNSEFKAATSELVTSSTGTNASNILIDGSTFTLSTGYAFYGFFSGGSTVQNSTITGSGTSIVYTGNTTSQSITFNNNDITASLSSVAFNFRGSGTYAVTNNDIELTGTAALLVGLPNGTSGTVTITGNDVVLKSAITDSPIKITSGTWTNTISNNTITLEDTSAALTSYDKGVIAVKNQSATTIEGNTIDTATSNQAQHVSITSSGTTGTATIQNNVFKTRSLSGYTIITGSDSSTSGDDKLNGSSIIGNTIYGPLYYAPSTSAGTSVTLHSIMFGFNQNGKIKRNIVNGGGYGIVYKDDGGTNTSGEIFQNLLINNRNNTALRLKGASGLKVYANTIYNDPQYTTYDPVNLGANADGTPSYSTNNLDFKNNIIYSGSTLIYNATSDTSRSTMSSDYNCFYKPNNSRIGWNSTTFEEWQSNNSFDVHSKFADPSFYNASTYDFRLTGNTGCASAGTDLSANSITTDLSSQALPLGYGYEPGVYELLMPLVPSSLNQYKRDDTDPISVGGESDDDDLDFRAVLSSNNSIDNLTLQIEIRPTREAFLNSPTHTISGDYAGSSFSKLINVNNLGNDNYHWQARTINVGGASAWVSFGGNASDASDFTIDEQNEHDDNDEEDDSDDDSDNTKESENSPALNSTASNTGGSNSTSLNSGYEEAEQSLTIPQEEAEKPSDSSIAQNATAPANKNNPDNFDTEKDSESNEKALLTGKNIAVGTALTAALGGLIYIFIFKPK